MSASKIAHHYAKALLELCAETKNQAVIGKQLETFAQLYAESPELRGMLKSPVVDADNKAAVLKRIFSKALFAPITRNFLLLLLEHGRISQIDVINAEFARRMDNMSRRVRAEVVSAVPLQRGDLNRIQGALQRLTGSTVVLDSRVDPKLIGGVVTRIGNLVLDGSVRTQLESLGDNLLT